MKNQTYEQKRIIELSRELDKEREKNKKLSEQSRRLSETIKRNEKEIQKINNQLQMEKQTKHKLSEQLKEEKNKGKLLELQNSSRRENEDKALLQNAEVRQKGHELKEQLIRYENKMKDLLYVKEKQIIEKEKQNFKLREQNIQIEKLYLKKKDETQKKEEKLFKTMAKVKSEVDLYRKDLQSMNQYLLKTLKMDKQKNEKQFQKVYSEIKRIEGLIQNEKKLKKQIRDLKTKLQELVMENSQKIIQLYQYRSYT